MSFRISSVIQNSKWHKTTSFSPMTMSNGWFAQSSESSPKSIGGMTGPVRIRLICCVSLQQDTWGRPRLPLNGLLVNSKWKWNEWCQWAWWDYWKSQPARNGGARCYALILESILRQDPIRESYLEGLKTVLGYFVVAKELLDIDSISTLLSLDNFNVLDCMKPRQ